MLHQGHGTATPQQHLPQPSALEEQERERAGGIQNTQHILPEGPDHSPLPEGTETRAGSHQGEGFPGGSWKSESVGAVSIAPVHPPGRQGCAAVKGLHGARTRPGCRRALNASRDSLLWRSHRAGGVPVTTSRFVTSPWGLWRDWPYPRTGIKS